VGRAGHSKFPIWQMSSEQPSTPSSQSFANVGDYVMPITVSTSKTPPAIVGRLGTRHTRTGSSCNDFHNASTTSLLVMEAQKRGGGINTISDPVSTDSPTFSKSRECHRQISGGDVALQLEEAGGFGPLTNAASEKSLWDNGATLHNVSWPPEGDIGMITSINVVKTTQDPRLAMKF